jgi:glycosyltransferase involved in cell wall biosynthesis
VVGFEAPLPLGYSENLPTPQEHSPKPKVLLIAYWFPPAGGIAVQRALSLAKYLPGCGFEVHVLAPLNPPSPLLDPTLIRQVPAEVTVHRAITPMPPSTWRHRLWKLVNRKPTTSTPAAAAAPAAAKRGGLSAAVRKLLAPDPEILWYPFALRKATAVIRRHQIATVIVTAPPFSTFVLGNALKRRFPNIRYISDFRDDWLRFFMSAFDFHAVQGARRKAAAIELETVTRSDAVVVVTPMLLRETRNRYPAIAPEKFSVIPNGYDPAMFTDFHPRSHEGTNVVITYVGTVYQTTSPAAYFNALDSLPEEVRSQIETRFVGRIAPEEQATLQNRKSPVKILGFMPQSEAIRYMEETDFLLVTMADPTAATGKLYEYLATRKPILAVAPKNGEIDLTFQETGAGWCADPSDPQAIREMLLNAFEMARGGNVQIQRNEAAIRRYERPQLAVEFAKLIHGLPCASQSDAHGQHE